MSDRRKGLLSSSGNPVPLKEINVSVTINGYVADILSTSLYVNEEESPIEAIFSFPVDDQSAVYNFEAVIDGRRLIAECHEKEQAKEIYDDAMSYGRRAMLLEEDDSAGDIFRCKLGNLPSKTEAKISMGFVKELDLEADGKVNFTLPTVLNPRYSPDLGGLKPTKGASYASADAIPYKLSFQLSVRGPKKIKGVHGPNDKLNVDYSEDQRVAQVTLDDVFKFDHDLSVLVEYESCNEPQIILEKGNPQTGGLLKEDVLMVNFFLEPPVEIPRATPGEFIFVVDRSGSMQGEKIQNAKETLLLFLKSLPVNCYFNVIGFGSNFESLFPGRSQKYNEENLSKAEELQRQMNANMGGTELLGPLDHVYNQKLIDNYPRQLFILTDGEVMNTAEVINLARRNSQHTRVFTVGIGQGASTALVRGLAKAGGGKEVFVTESERLQPKVISLLQCAMQPVATDVEIAWDLPSSVSRVMIPSNIPYIFLGARQILYVMLSGMDAVVCNPVFSKFLAHPQHRIPACKSKNEMQNEKNEMQDKLVKDIKDPSYVCSMTLKGKLISTSFEYKETFSFHGHTETSTFAHIHRLAAKTQIKELQINEAPKEQIVHISKSANVISKHTAFVMVDTDGNIVKGMAMERVVPTPRSVFPQQRMCKSCAAPSMRDIDVSACSSADADQLRTSGCHSDLTSDHARFLDYATADQTVSADAPRRLLRLNRKTPSYLSSMSSPISSLDCTIESKTLCDDSIINSSEAKRMSGCQRMMDVIRLQKFQGSWSLDNELLDLLETDAESLKRIIPLQDDSVVATVAVITWLRKHHSERRDEWKMLETKALDWLQGQNLQGHSVEELMSRDTIGICS